ncbi:hypothetical protein CSA56_05960 [candidate division KSB3 bacterium]|uniref:SCP2 domain-containing protein n=1 Tax=candidate division KSB3 bacterium TaxID=2044937 RepID=A0A2G6KJ27_9BACT|nr:MAG: hypothetical protein CSA56_05960 [candidate division KSB3 bacterium]
MEKIITQCSSCQAKFKLGGDKIGKKIRCPKCKGVFVVNEIGVQAKPAPVPRPELPQPAPAPSTVETPPAAPSAEEPTATPAVEQEVVPLKDRPRPLKVADFFETQHTRFLPDQADGVNAHISYDITGEGGGQWTLIVKDGRCEIQAGGDPSAKTRAKMTAKTYLKLAQGKLDGRVAFMLGKIKLKGDKASVATVRGCFKVPEI